jgi:hypothetical protein
MKNHEDGSHFSWFEIEMENRARAARHAHARRHREAEEWGWQMMRENESPKRWLPDERLMSRRSKWFLAAVLWIGFVLCVWGIIAFVNWMVYGSW